MLGSARLVVAIASGVLLALPGMARPQGSYTTPRFPVEVRRLGPADSCSAVAVVDVNRDGRPDVLCGTRWFEGPTGQEHPLPLRGPRQWLQQAEFLQAEDLDGDDHADLVGYVPEWKTLFWVRNPGNPQGQRAWTIHVVAQGLVLHALQLVPLQGRGPRKLVGSGPAGAWFWHAQKEGAAIRFLRHELPGELAGHGLGWGDIDGDDRIDLVGCGGWAAAPARPLKQPWRGHPQFRLHPDASAPVLVLDVDGDGDTDLLYGRGHAVGLYWLRRDEPESHKEFARWRLQAIDTQFGQFHAPLAADLDGDGSAELVVGRRLAEDCRLEPGSFDPPGVWCYRYQKEQKTWRRLLLTWDEQVDWGTGPAAVDFDGDGRLDLLCAGRHGVFWLRNRRGEKSPPAAPRRPDPLDAPLYPDHKHLLLVADQRGEVRPVLTPRAWGRRRWHVLAHFQRVAGVLPGPESRVPLAVRIHSQEELPQYTRYKITFASEPGDRVPAWLLVPKGICKPRPAMICPHQTIRMGKDEVAGLAGRPTRQYGHELAARGYVCLVPDYPSFGEYSYDFQPPRHRHPSGTIKGIWNHIRAVDLLESLPQVDPDRIGTIGHSLGGHNSIFVAAFDRRLRVVVTSCGFTPFHYYYGGRLQGWTSLRYMPRIARWYGNDPDRVPFDFYELVGVLAPRAFLTSSPLRDHNFDVRGVKLLEVEVRRVYRLLGAQQRLEFLYPDCEHDFPDPVRRRVYQWLDRVMRRDW